MPSVLVVDDDRALRRILESFLREEGCEVETVEGGREALARLRSGGFDLCLLDMGLPDLDGMSVLRQLRSGDPIKDVTPIIVVSGRDDMQSTVDAVRLGAYDYLLKPIDLDLLRLTVARTLEQRRTNQTLPQLLQQTKEQTADRLVGRSEAIRVVFKMVGAVAKTRATVLLCGESGTGKEQVARAIHLASGSGAQPFVTVSCSAFAPDLLEAELFGQIKDASPSGVPEKIGRLALAGEGTVFLDEIGELPRDLQAKLLRVLEERTFERVGDGKPQRLLARVIAATHRDLAALVVEGSFRGDLFDRLRAVEILVPPLRERAEDVPSLISHLLGKIGRDLHAPPKALSEAAMSKLVAHSWPGNVRELENVLSRACVLSKGDVLGPECFLTLTEATPTGTASAPGNPLPAAGSPSTLRDVERDHVTRVLLHTAWNKRRACALLAITRPTLDRKIKEYGLIRPQKELAAAGGLRPRAWRLGRRYDRCVARRARHARYCEESPSRRAVPFGSHVGWRGRQLRALLAERTPRRWISAS